MSRAHFWLRSAVCAREYLVASYTRNHNASSGTEEDDACMGARVASKKLGKIRTWTGSTETNSVPLPTLQ